MKRVVPSILIVLWLAILLVPAVAQEATPPFSVVRLLTAAGVADREPVDIADTFPASVEHVVCFLEADDIATDTTAVFVWYLQDVEMARVPVPVKAGKRWRTWSSKTIAGRSGSWRVDLEDNAGQVLKSVRFTVQ